MYVYHLVCKIKNINLNIVYSQFPAPISTYPINLLFELSQKTCFYRHFI